MKILMVCLGNICRSPLAEGLLSHKVERDGLDLVVDSAGTSGYHEGELADPRMRATSKAFGVPLEHIRSRQFRVDDFQNFDLIFAMDASNYNNIIALASSEEEKAKVRLILNESYPGKNLAVPDPYYGGDKGFEEVYRLLDEATDIFLKNLKSNE
jgi:protein-tyrosine phosphatase